MKTNKSIEYSKFSDHENIFAIIDFTLLLVDDRVAYAKEFQKTAGLKSTDEVKSTAAGCEPGSSYKYLDINNVKPLSILMATVGSLKMPSMKYLKDQGNVHVLIFPLDRGYRHQQQPELAGYRYGQGPSTSSPHTKMTLAWSAHR